MSPDLTIEEALNNMLGLKVLVVGDMMLDTSLYYEKLKEANEFKGDILTERTRTNYPGGAANVAMNCKHLGGDVTLLGVFGTDRAGLNLASILQGHLIDVPTINWKDRTCWSTTHKTRVCVGETPIHRIDRDGRGSLSIEETLAHIAHNQYDLLLLSDYQKGVLTSSEFVHGVLNFFKAKNPNVVIAANPKPPLVRLLSETGDLTHVNLVVLNRAEMSECSHMLDTLTAPHVVLHTLGEEGVELGIYGYRVRFPTIHIDNPDVVGCGDSAFAAAAMTLANGSGYTFDILGKIAVAAGTSKAKKNGTLPITTDDILQTCKELNDDIPNTGAFPG